APRRPSTAARRAAVTAQRPAARRAPAGRSVTSRPPGAVAQIGPVHAVQGEHPAEHRQLHDDSERALEGRDEDPTEIGVLDRRGAGYRDAVADEAPGEEGERPRPEGDVD